MNKTLFFWVLMLVSNSFAQNLVTFKFSYKNKGYSITIPNEAYLRDGCTDETETWKQLKYPSAGYKLNYNDFLSSPCNPAKNIVIKLAYYFEPTSTDWYPFISAFVDSIPGMSGGEIQTPFEVINTNHANAVGRWVLTMNLFYTKVETERPVSKQFFPLGKPWEGTCGPCYVRDAQGYCVVKCPEGKSCINGKCQSIPPPIRKREPGGNH